MALIKVSIIVPVYNTRDYLKECIDSVVNQTLEDIEIICINDGSGDGSLDLLNEYQKRDSRIIVIDRENSGLAASRNVGLDIARGEYVLFLDSDDYLDKSALDYLYSTSKDMNLDMLMFKIVNFSNRTRKESHSPYFDMDFLKETVQDSVFCWADIRDCIFDVSVTATSKLFKRQLIGEIRFPEGLIFEDNLFFIKTLFEAKRIYFADRYLYYRRIRPDSITNSYHGDFSDCIEIYERLIEFMKDMGRYTEFHTQIFDRQCFDCFHRFSQLDEEFKEDFHRRLKDNFLSQEDCLKNNGTLETCSERSLEIYTSAINSDTYREFELAVEVFDLKVKNRDCKKKISKLKKANRKHLKEIEELENSAGPMKTRILRKFNSKLKK